MAYELLTRAEFYDFFGAIAFLFVIFVAIFQLKAKKVLANWIYILLLIVGTVGLIVDVALVYGNFLR